MAKRHSQQTLHMWLGSPKRSRPEATSDDQAPSMGETLSESEVRVSEVDSSNPISTETFSTTESSTATSSEGVSQPDSSACILPCCTDPKPFQSVNPVVLATLANKGRNFVV